MCDDTPILTSAVGGRRSIPPPVSSTGRHRLDDACARHGRCGRHGTESAFGGRRFGGGCGIRSFIVRAFTPIAAQAALMTTKSITNRPACFRVRAASVFRNFP